MRLATSRLHTFLLGMLSGALLALSIAVAAKHNERITAEPSLLSAAASASGGAAAPCPTAPVAAVVPPADSAKPGDAAPPPRVAGTMPLEVIDAARVDPQELVGRVKGLALSVERHGKLVHIITSALSQDGSVDLTAGGTIDYYFDYRYPGATQNAVTGRVTVTVKQGGITATISPGAGDDPVEPLADPICPLRSAWRQATKGGPPGGKAHAEYVRHPRTKGSVWMVLAPGSPAYERSVDGLNCAILDGGPHGKRKEGADPY